jgi:hypothetical protein
VKKYEILGFGWKSCFGQMTVFCVVESHQGEKWIKLIREDGRGGKRLQVWL